MAQNVEDQVFNVAEDITNNISDNTKNIERLFSKNQILNELVNDQHKDMCEKYNDLLKENKKMLSFIMDLRKTIVILAATDILTLIVLVVHIAMSM